MKVGWDHKRGCGAAISTDVCVLRCFFCSGFSFEDWSSVSSSSFASWAYLEVLCIFSHKVDVWGGEKSDNDEVEEKNKEKERQNKKSAWCIQVVRKRGETTVRIFCLWAPRASTLSSEYGLVWSCMVFSRFDSFLFSRGGERLRIFFRPAVHCMLRSTGDAEAGRGKVEVRCQLVRSRGKRGSQSGKG